MRKVLVFLLSLLSPWLSAQNLPEAEARLAELQVNVGQAGTDEERMEASEAIRNILKESFSKEGAFEYPFQSLHKIAIIYSPDRAFRLFNWNVPFLDGTNRYFAFILFPGKGKFVELMDSSTLDFDDLSQKHHADDWYGALYYEIHEGKLGKTDYYTLVGWDGNDNLTTIKLLDAMTIDRKGRVEFGLPVFQLDGVLVGRRIFEFADEVSMTLRYLEPKNAIVFDHLEPISQSLGGQRSYYGPGTSHDAYVLAKDGTWELVENLDMTRPKGSETGAQFNFPDKVNFERKRNPINPLTGE